MSSAIRRVGWMAGAVLAIACAVSIAAWAGGSGFGDDDDNSEEEGPSYFGFVRDTSGATVPDAKVTVGVKNRGGVVTRTDLLGTYKVPGFGKEVDPKDVEVRLENNVLTLRGERKWNGDVQRENYHRVERAYGSFTRSFTLPNVVDTEKIKADFKDGMLRLTLPKREEAKPKQISINVAR